MEKTFDAAFLHRAAIAEEAFKKLRLVWNSSLSQAVRLRIFQSTFTPTLIYALDTLTLTQKQLDRVDAFFIRFLRRVVRIKASYYSHIPNTEVMRKARYPTLPSAHILNAQHKSLKQVFMAPRTEPTHSVVFTAAFKDRILAQGRRRGMQIPYWLEVLTKRFFPAVLGS